MRRLYLDIETLPAAKSDRSSLEILFNKKKEKNKKKDTETKNDFEQYLLGTSFDGAFGRILCIGYAVDDKPVECLYNDNDERTTLKEFWEVVDSVSSSSGNGQYADHQTQFIGHNLIDFDMRFIYQRSIVNNVKPSYEVSFARYRNYPMFDTMKEWVKWNNNNIGLEHLALALGIPTPKEGIDGSQVYAFYKAGKISEICEYCKRDVECTRSIYKKMNFIV